jgi:transcriptional regulator with XRE-family HTH domain
MALRTTSPGFNDPRYKEVIDRLVEQRRKLGLRQQDVAERLGLHRQFVSRVELGERRLDVVEFADFAKALDLSPSGLLDSITPR